MYLKRKIASDELRDELDKNSEIIGFMSDTITNFEDFYKAGESEWFDPSDAVRQAVNIVEKILSLQEIRLILELDGSARIFGQRNGLSQVVLSALQNSIDKHRTNRAKDKWIRIALADSSPLTLIIEDNAGGIDAKPIEAIFEPFFSSKKSSSTGLGLYMSRLVVEEKFGGTIGARNSTEGAIITITIGDSQVSRRS
jgi:signal transduction histidine kinase